ENVVVASLHAPAPRQFFEIVHRRQSLRGNGLTLSRLRKRPGTIGFWPGFNRDSLERPTITKSNHDGRSLQHAPKRSRFECRAIGAERPGGLALSHRRHLPAGRLRTVSG